MTLDELTPGMIVQDGKMTLKVHVVWPPSRAYAFVMIPTEPPGQRRGYTPEQVANWTVPTEEKMARYRQLYPEDEEARL
jgi:hypothetical protein